MGAIDNRTPADRIGNEGVELSRCRDFPSIMKCRAHGRCARISEKTPGRDLRHIWQKICSVTRCSWILTPAWNRCWLCDLKCAVIARNDQCAYDARGTDACIAVVFRDMSLQRSGTLRVDISRKCDFCCPGWLECEWAMSENILVIPGKFREGESMACIGGCQWYYRMCEVTICWHANITRKGRTVSCKAWHSHGMLWSSADLIEQDSAVIGNMETARSDTISIAIAQTKGDGFGNRSSIIAATFSHMGSFSLASIGAGKGIEWMILTVLPSKKWSGFETLGRIRNYGNGLLTVLSTEYEREDIFTREWEVYRWEYAICITCIVRGCAAAVISDTERIGFPWFGCADANFPTVMCCCLDILEIKSRHTSAREMQSLERNTPRITLDIPRKFSIGLMIVSMMKLEFPDARETALSWYLTLTRTLDSTGNLECIEREKSADFFQIEISWQFSCVFVYSSTGHTTHRKRSNNIVITAEKGEVSCPGGER